MKQRAKVSLSIVLLLSLLALPPFVWGDDLPSTLSYEGNTLQLNGTGYRTATIFALKVYKAALYLDQKSSDPDTIIGSSKTRVLKLFFERDVDVEKLQHGWAEGFERSGLDPATFSTPLAQLKGAMRDTEDGDVLTLAFLPEELRLQWGSDAPTTIVAPHFSSTILQIWLGANPPNEALKRGLLGIG